MERLFLVGDNPFHRISHLSQERARNRIEDPGDPVYAARLLRSSLENGANGFTFSISETSLSILRNFENQGSSLELRLYPIVPYAIEYVRLATQLGGIGGLVKRIGSQMIMSGSIGTIGLGLKGSE